MNASTSTISTPRPGGDQALHPAVTKIWKRMLDATYPDAASGSPPEIDRWHRAYVEAGRGRRTNRPFRHVGRRPSCTSGPTGLAEHRKRFIEDLPVPGGGRQAIPAFRKGRADGPGNWRGLLWDVHEPSGGWSPDQNWNLDTGIDMEAGSGARPYFWA